jgi:hypothetical protein
MMFFICDYIQLVTSSNDMMLIKLFAFFLLFKNSEACARSSLDNISNSRHHNTQSSPFHTLAHNIRSLTTGYLLWIAAPPVYIS